MHGQWIGEFTGSNSGIILIDIDDSTTFYEGHAYLYDRDPDHPITSAYFRTKDQGKVHRVEVDPIPMSRVNIPLDLDEYTKQYPDIAFPAKASVRLEEVEGGLSVSWTTSVGSSGSAVIGRSQSDRPSNIKADPKVTSWAKFWAFVVKQEAGRFVYRGQSRPWRLRTAFHRTRRKDLRPFMDIDIPDLLRAVSSQSKLYFNLRDDLQYGAFWHLVQHHGYPTPMLDWTASPFVAAYFAYRSDPSRTASQKKVRVLMFDKREWVTDFRQQVWVAPSPPHFSLIQPLAISNNRTIPQQAVSFVTNIDDVEDYIRDRERLKGKQYLHAFDLPYAERDEVLRQLTLMGVTAGALFPGLDGACEDLRARHFGFGA